MSRLANESSGPSARGQEGLIFKFVFVSRRGVGCFQLPVTVCTFILNGLFCAVLLAGPKNCGDARLEVLLGCWARSTHIVLSPPSQKALLANL